jgi:hypothetical protein
MSDVDLLEDLSEESATTSEPKPKSFWEGVADAKATVYERGVELGEGDYVAKIRTCKNIATQRHGDAFIVEFDVMKSTNSQYPVGTMGKWYRSLVDKPRAQPELKKFFAAVLECNLATPEGQRRFDTKVAPKMGALADAVCSEKQNLFGGKMVAIQVRPGKEKQDGGRFMNLHFFPVKDV